MSKGILVIAALLITSCAWVDVKRVNGTDMETKGFRYYETKPLLLVTADNSQIVFVPNYSRAYSVKFGAFLSKHDVKLTIKDGVYFSEIDDHQDPAEFIKGLIALGQEAVKAASSAARAASETVTGKLVAVYEFDFDDQGNIKGMKKLNVDPVK